MPVTWQTNPDIINIKVTRKQVDEWTRKFIVGS